MGAAATRVTARKVLLMAAFKGTLPKGSQDGQTAMQPACSPRISSPLGAYMRQGHAGLAQRRALWAQAVPRRFPALTWGCAVAMLRLGCR